MADYSAAVVKAVQQMIAHKGASNSGVTTAARKGKTRALPDQVDALREWLSKQHPTLKLHTWDNASSIGLPVHNSGADWKSFEEKWLQPILDDQRSVKRDVKRLKSEAFTDEALSSLLSEELGEAAEVKGDVIFHGNVSINGTLKATSLETRGADYTERFAKADPSEAIEAGAVVGIFDDAKVAEGVIRLRTGGAIRLGIVSTLPSVCGAVTDTAKDTVAVCVADWPGRLPVLIRGPVKPGDSLVASGCNDGMAMAIKGEDVNSIGIALSAPVDGRVTILTGSAKRAVDMHRAPPHSPLSDSAGSWDLCDASTCADEATNIYDDTGRSETGRSDASLTELKQAIEGGMGGGGGMGDMAASLMVMQEQMKMLLRKNEQLEAQNQRHELNLDLMRELQPHYPKRDSSRVSVATRKVIVVQKLGRGYLGRCRARRIVASAATCVQKASRSYVCRRQYARQRQSLLCMQAAARRCLSRRRFHTVRDATTRLQAAQRMRVQHVRYATQSKSIRMIQRLMRGYCSRLLHNLKRTKTALQRELLSSQEQNERLEHELLSSQEQHERLREEKACQAATIGQMRQEKAASELLQDALRSQLAKEKAKSEARLADLRRQLDEEKAGSAALQKQWTKQKKELKELKKEQKEHLQKITTLHEEENEKHAKREGELQRKWKALKETSQDLQELHRAAGSDVEKNKKMVAERDTKIQRQEGTIEELKAELEAPATYVRVVNEYYGHTGYVAFKVTDSVESLKEKVAECFMTSDEHEIEGTDITLEIEDDETELTDDHGNLADWGIKAGMSLAASW